MSDKLYYTSFNLVNPFSSMENCDPNCSYHNTNDSLHVFVDQTKNNIFSELAENQFLTESLKEHVFKRIPYERNSISPSLPGYSNNESKKRKRELDEYGVESIANKHFKKKARVDGDDKELSLMEKVEIAAEEKLVVSDPVKVVDFECEGLPFIAELEGNNVFDGNIKIFLWQGEVLQKGAPDFLGNGAFGVAQKVYDVTNETFKAMKIANSVFYPDHASEELRREYQTINDMNGGTKKAIQKTPDLYVDNLLPNKPAMIQTLYSGDLSQSKYQKLKPDEKVNLLIQVFKGINEVHQTHIHGDVKCKNIFVMDPQNKLSSYVVYIADLGGAKKTCDVDENFFANTSYIGTTHTQGYLTDNDRTKLYEAYKSLDKEKWVELQKKRDIFAGVLSACHFLTGKEQTYKSKDEFSKTIENIKNSLRPLLGESTINILIQALNEDPLLRPDVCEIIDALENKANVFSKDGLSEPFTLAPSEMIEQFEFTNFSFPSLGIESIPLEPFEGVSVENWLFVN